MKSKIYIKDWLLFKPYHDQSKTDFYYLQLSNKVRNIFENQIIGYHLLKYLEIAELKELSCFLTSYFEDVISGTNIWNSFVRVHKRLYNKSLPFFNLEDYTGDEINVQDVSFLIWYYINAVQEDKFISPYAEFIPKIAEDVMDVFDEAWEFAPENEHLKAHYELDKSEVDYYYARKFIDRVLFDTYLFFDAKILLAKSELKLINDEKFENEPERLLALLNNNRDSHTHSTHTSLLALKGKEWAAEILGDAHPRSSDIIEMSPRIQGFFLYKGQDADSIFLEHIASAKEFKLTKKGFENPDVFNLSTPIQFIGIVRYRDEWWFSGVKFQQPYNADFIREEKNNVDSRAKVNFLDHENADINDTLQIHFKVFLEYNKGSQIAFMLSSGINSFLQGYINAVNSQISLSNQDVLGSEYQGGEEDLEPVEVNAVFDVDDSTPGLIFFNPKSGCEIAFYVNSAFPLPNNPYFDISESEEATYDLLMEDALSPQLVNYCIEHCKDKLEVFQSSEGIRYLEDLDFLLRYWKTNNYNPIPTISVTDRKESE